MDENTAKGNNKVKKSALARDAQQYKDIAHSAYIEKGGYTLLVHKSIYFIVGMIAFILIWAALTKVSEVAVSYGEIMPLKDVHVVQHLQGGTVQKVFVKNGQEVKQGEILIKLDPDVVRAELDKALSQEISLMLNAVRLEAFVDKKSADSVEWEKIIKNHPYNIPENTMQIRKSINEDRNLLRQENQERNNRYNIYNEKITQKKAELKEYEDTKLEIEKRLKLHQREEEMFRSVVGKGYVSKRDYLAAQRKTIEAISQLKQVDAKMKAARSALNEAQQELTSLDTSYNKKALEELNTIDAELLTVRHTIQRLTQLNRRLVIAAPISGIVKGLTVSPGSVISPAQGVLDIVPTHGDMIVNARISTKDIGHVKVGDPAHVKVVAYEFTRYGYISGDVIEISASTFSTEKGLPYYRAKVLLDKNYVGENEGYNKLKPGMTVQVDIITGRKSVLAYLMKPITRGVKTAFRER